MKKILALAALAALSTTPAVAEDRGFYWGFDLGQYQYNLDQNDIDTSLVAGLEDLGYDVGLNSSETSEDGFTWGLTLGYQFFRFLAVEAAWVDLGSAEYKANIDVGDPSTDPPTVIPLDTKITTDSSGATLSALGILPFATYWQVYGRAGVYFANNDLDVSASSGDVGASGEDSDNTQEFYWGLGAGYTQAQWTLRLEWQQYMDVGDESTTGETDIDRITLGAIYKF
jgi:opacity protein-like surface antigen